MRRIVSAVRAVRAVRAVVMALAACNPASSRPALAPYPEDLSILLGGPVSYITSEAGGWFESQGIHTEWISAEDGYVETTWYNTDTHQSTSGTGDIGTLQTTFKVRVWVDPDAPGKSKMTVEAVYRPSVDPSRTERDLERSAPPGSGGAVLVQRLVDEMQKKFGS
jgi:hypothetical protein